MIINELSFGMPLPPRSSLHHIVIMYEEYCLGHFVSTNQCLAVAMWMNPVLVGTRRMSVKVPWNI